MAELAGACLHEESPQLHLFAQHEYVGTHIAELFAIMVDNRDIHLSRQLPMVAHVPLESRREIDEQVVLPFEIEVFEIEIHTAEYVHTLRHCSWHPCHRQ